MITPNTMNMSSLTTARSISTSSGSISSQYGMYNYHQPLSNGSSRVHVGSSQFTGNPRFDGAVDVFGTFSSNGNAKFSGSITPCMTAPTFFDSFKDTIGRNRKRYRNINGYLSNTRRHSRTSRRHKLEDGTAGSPYGANYIQNIG